MIVIFAGPMLYFAFGAGITGFLFLVSDDVPDEPDRGLLRRSEPAKQKAPLPGAPFALFRSASAPGDRLACFI